MLEVGTKAPDFTLKNQEGQEVSLSQFAGKRVVLYFYPRDNTPGCTRQACGFAQNYAGFTQRDVVVIGNNDKAKLWDAEAWNAKKRRELTPEQVAETMLLLGL